jgi:hypothetical protein
MTEVRRSETARHDRLEIRGRETDCVSSLRAAKRERSTCDCSVPPMGVQFQHRKAEDDRESFRGPDSVGIGTHPATSIQSPGKGSQPALDRLQQEHFPGSFTLDVRLGSVSM